MSLTHGLSEKAVAQIHQVFSHHPELEKAVLYGSRAKGTARQGSDIDLVLFGSKLDRQLLYRLNDELDDLMLPYEFDISIFSSIDEPKLLEHIDRAGYVFYQKDPVETKR